MKYWKLAGATLVVVCALAAVTVASASATLPTILPETVTEFTGKQIGTESVLEEKSGTKVKCTEATGEGTIESNRHLGLFHIHFSSCTTKIVTASGTCTGLGENSGIILSLGSWHEVLLWLPSASGWSRGILYLLAPVHFTCTVSGVEHLFLVKAGGMVLCSQPSTTEPAKVIDFSCKKRSSPFGPEYTKYLNEAEASTNAAPLETEENSNGKEEESVENAEGTTESSTAIEIMG